MTKRKNTKTAKARAFMQSNPAVSPSEVANRFDMSKQTVYVLRNTMKKKGFVFPKKEEQMPSLAPARKVTVSASQIGIARAMGVPLDEYVKEGLKQGVFKYDDELEQTGIEMPPMPEVNQVDKTLDARAVDYGKFIEGAEVMQMLKRVVQNALSNRDKVLAHDQAESMDMIIHKIGRIINGNPDVVDHWLDIAGYAQLVADRLEGRIR
jgi:transposase